MNCRRCDGALLQPHIDLNKRIVLARQVREQHPVCVNTFHIGSRCHLGCICNLKQLHIVPTKHIELCPLSTPSKLSSTILTRQGMKSQLLECGHTSEILTKQTNTAETVSGLRWSIASRSSEVITKLLNKLEVLNSLAQIRKEKSTPCRCRYCQRCMAQVPNL